MGGWEERQGTAEGQDDGGTQQVKQHFWRTGIHALYMTPELQQCGQYLNSSLKQPHRTNKTQHQTSDQIQT